MPAYTPYDGSAKPFTIGVSALKPEHWIEPDDDLGRYLDEKAALAKARYDDIFRALPDTIAAQRECLDLLTSHLLADHSDRYRRNGHRMEMAGHAVDLDDDSVPPLMRAGSLIQDDLVLLRRKADGWTIVAAHLAFPSSWSLAEKFNRPMDQVHATVPGFEGGTRNATLVNRIFDNLQPQLPATRLNWSINWTYALYHPAPHKTAVDPHSVGVAAANAFVRVERQTLRKLPVSGDIVFTIRIYLDPAAAVMAGPDGRRLALALAEQLRSMSGEQVAYKGLVDKRQALIEFLTAGTMVENPA
ncbi:MAG: heme-dependent oxidative N-demethylase family protein [Allorhizobium sp.]